MILLLTAGIQYLLHDVPFGFPHFALSALTSGGTGDGRFLAALEVHTEQGSSAAPPRGPDPARPSPGFR